jgi:ribosome biogenesis GTPase / thiamine phosphate phosphatase
VREGTVVEYHREYCWVQSIQDDGTRREVIAKPRGRLELTAKDLDREHTEDRELEKVVTQQIAVGDRVMLSEPEPGSFTIDEIIPRETWLIRSNLSHYRKRPQCVVANADQLAVVVAPNPDIKLSIVDRYFLAAIQGGLNPLLVVNKIDLDPNLPDSVEIRNYRERGYRVYFTAAKHGVGLDELLSSLNGVFTAFCGHSGAGKSTILGKLTGVDITVGAVHGPTQKGRQTTSTARLYHLPSGGEVVDTPGIREFGLAHLTWLDVHDYFSDVAELTQRCGFRDCSHTVEPGCAVQQAVAAQQISVRRVESYVKLRAECST